MTPAPAAPAPRSPPAAPTPPACRALARALWALLLGAATAPLPAAAADTAPVPATRTGGRQVLPVDLHATGGLSGVGGADAAWLAQHFEWKPAIDAQGALGPMRLHPRARADTPGTRWQARYKLGLAAAQGPRGPVARYTIAPVRAGLLQALRDEAIASCCMKPDPAHPAAAGDPAKAHEARLLAWIVPIRLRFDAARQMLSIESDEPVQWQRSQMAVEELGARVDARLAAGQWREHLGAGPALAR